MKIIPDKIPSGIPVMRFDGDLDYHASADLRSGLNKFLESPHLLLDLAKVGYMDSSGIAVFVELSQKIKAHGGKIVFFNLAPAVKSVFELAKLHLFFSIAGSQEEAVKIVSG
ncbi:MAG TPA: STAS domain-containing protein [Verrucomicrobiae bacterium]|jgi:anti-sigma B factor antagonist|nr:STAS domain-containing protein [Verrucomicrobiae bacterium]